MCSPSNRKLGIASLLCLTFVCPASSLYLFQRERLTEKLCFSLLKLFSVSPSISHAQICYILSRRKRRHNCASAGLRSQNPVRRIVSRFAVSGGYPLPAVKSLKLAKTGYAELISWGLHEFSVKSGHEHFRGCFFSNRSKAVQRKR